MFCDNAELSTGRTRTEADPAGPDCPAGLCPSPSPLSGPPAALSYAQVNENKALQGPDYGKIYNFCISYLFLEALGMFLAAQERLYKFSHLRCKMKSLIYNMHLK